MGQDGLLLNPTEVVTWDLDRMSLWASKAAGKIGIVVADVDLPIVELLEV